MSPQSDRFDRPYEPSAASTQPEASPADQTTAGGQIPTRRLIKTEELWALTLRAIRARLATVLAAVTISLLFTFVFQALLPFPSSSSRLASLIKAMVGTWGSLWIILSVHDWLMGPAPGASAASRANAGDSPVRRAVQALAPALVVNFLAYAIMLLGLVLLIVPGVMAAVYLSLAIPIVALGQARGFAALRRSRDLVLGRWGEVFTRLVVLLLPFLFVLGLQMGLVIGGAQTWLHAFEGNPNLLAGILLARSLFMDLLVVPLTIGQLILYMNLAQLREQSAAELPTGTQTK